MTDKIMLLNDKYVNKSMFQRHTSWISIEDEPPMENQKVDIWIKEHIDPSGNNVPARREIDQIFKQFVTGKWAFQDEACHKWGLHELAYLIDEDLITYWIPSPIDPII